MIVNSAQEVIEMNIPGFTAEASLFKGNPQYQANPQANPCDGIVQPALSLSDVVSLDPNSPYGHDSARWNCLKYVCWTVVVHRHPTILWRECQLVPGIC